MEGTIVMVLLLVFGVPIALFIWLGVKASRAARGVQELESRFDALQAEVYSLWRELRTRGTAPSAAPTREQPEPAPVPIAPPPEQTEPSPEPTEVTSPPAAIPPPIRLAGRGKIALRVPTPPVGIPPPIPEPARASVVNAPSHAARPPEPVRERKIDWEQFMGVKLFAWIGGFALFLGLVFFLKYAFENKLISPEMQVALEYVLGAGMLVGGIWMHRKQYAVTGQTLCATAVVALYAVTFASHSYYRLLGIAPCFAVMVLVTAAAFLLAVQLDAQVVAILGLLGGFLTPVLLSTGKDNPVGLFSYIALLDIGLLAVVRRKQWNHLALLAAVSTVLMQAAWVAKFFAVSKVFIAMSVFLGFEVLFLVAFALTDRESPWNCAAAIVMAFAPLAFTLYLFDFRELATKPWIIFSFVLAADLGALMLVLLRDRLAAVHLVAGTAVFIVMGIWTTAFLSNALLNWALAFYLLFAILHTAFPVVLQRLRPGAAPMWWGHLFPPLALLLVMIPIVRLPELTWLVWVCVLAVDCVVFVLALVTASILAVIGALVLTLLAAATWILKVPAVVSGVPDMLIVIGGFALVFFVIGVLAARRLTREPVPGEPAAPTPAWLPTLSGDARAQIPAFSAILPFVLLIMVVLRMPVANPSPVFGLAMLLVVLLLGVARWTSIDLLAAVGLVCSAALQYAWHEERFKPEFAVAPLMWHLAFVAVFTVFPFLFRSEMRNRIVPWATSALAGPVHFTLVYRVVKAAWPNPVMGLLPAAFAIPPLIGLLVVVRGQSDRRLSQLAWFGGATLFFVTLIFPIQWERQWLTIAWALEGAALLWLFHRVPHNGLRLVGVALLCVAFVRLALNPSVLEYHPRSGTAIWNWYLYAYGIATACLFAGAKLLAPPRDRIGGLNAPALLATLGTVLAFLLLNIEIADYFTPVGALTLTFRFSGIFARDMTYSIAWAMFALMLLVAGIAKKLRAPRYASLALLGVTLMKLFIHDLSRLNQLYRIGAFVGVAVILLAASFLYQKFVTPSPKES
jgi:hypothetical protein